jgi:nicotinamidase/pyrazinamidase
VPFPYDAQTALLVVDMQNDFADPRGSLYVSGGESMVGAINEHIEAARAAGALVVYTQDWHPADTPHFAKDGGVWPVHCVHDTWGAQLHPDLVVVNGERVYKGTGGEDGYSGFTMAHPVTGETTPTDLLATLKDHGIERVVIAGLATDYCVRETSIDAIRLGFTATVLREAVRPVELEPGDGQRAVEAMVAAGVALA